MPTSEITYGVPPSKVDRLIDDYETIGATATKALQKDGTFIVTAVFGGPVHLRPLAMATAKDELPGML